MSNMIFNIPLSKIDEEKRLVIGRAVQEVRDRSGEILDYATAKPAFQEWSESFVKATGGLSKGNVRVMHNPKVVAGKVTNISYNDDEKAIDVMVKVVDDNEWKKVLEGVYTGFSVGGSYAKKWQDGEVTRYTPRVAEISLVDRPCIPTCSIIELHKSDGSIEEIRIEPEPLPARTFKQMTPPKTFAELAKGELSQAELQQRRDAARASAEARSRKNLSTEHKAGYAPAAILGAASGGLGTLYSLAATGGGRDHSTSAARDTLASVLRRKNVRSRLHEASMKYAKEHVGDAPRNEKADAAYRKVMQEAKDRGDTDMAGAESRAKMFADKVRARTGAGGEAAHAEKIRRARADFRHRSVKAGVEDLRRSGVAPAILRNKTAVGLAAAGALAGGVGSTLYHHSLKNAMQGEMSTGKQKTQASAGGALSAAGLGIGLGAGVGHLVHQGARTSRKTRAGLAAATVLAAAGGLGALAGHFGQRGTAVNSRQRILAAGDRASSNENRKAVKEWLSAYKADEAMDLRKGYREHDGRYSSETGRKVGDFVGSVGGGLAGYKAGQKYGPMIGAKIASRSGDAIHALVGRSYGGKYGPVVGGVAGAVAGGVAGSAIGAGIDKLGRRYRAKKAGRMDVYQRLNGKNA